jgi:hypothetical protein
MTKGVAGQLDLMMKAAPNVARRQALMLLRAIVYVFAVAPEELYER